MAKDLQASRVRDEVFRLCNQNSQSECRDPSSATFAKRSSALPQDEIGGKEGPGNGIPRELALARGNRRAELGGTAKAVPYPNR